MEMRRMPHDDILQSTEATPGHVASAEGLGSTAPRPRVLDPASGSRMMWFDRGHPGVVFGDRRSETLTVTDRSHGRADGTRTLKIEPDVLLDFRALPYPDGTFKLVAFDPPHLVRAGPRSWLAAKYGKLGQDWRDELRAGFAECFRVLDADGVLVFKWSETQVKLSEVLALTPHAPLFGNTSGKKAGTHWLVFMKPNAKGQRGAACGASAGPTGCASNGDTEDE
jgi:SAM-dependent methyltransferase